MSLTSQITPRKPGNEVLVLGVLAVLAIALAWYLSRDREVPLPTSAMGHEGVVRWLKSNGIETRYATGAPLDAATVGLRILPVLDTDLETFFEKPDTREEYLKTGTEIDLFTPNLETKVELIPSLVIAPKWTRAVRHSGYVHPSLLLPAEQPARALQALDIFGGDIVRSDAQISSFDLADMPGLAAPVTLYAPQFFPHDLSEGCAPVISDVEGVLLARCERDGVAFHALSDPDLMNNHGLSMAGNPEFAAALVNQLRREGPVLIDTHPYVFAFEERPPPYRRNWSDLLRLFEWPMALVWWGLAIVSALGLWRSWVRFGPPRRLFDDSLSAARSVSIAAKARLLRMTGNDRRLFETHIRGRIRMLATALAGEHASGVDPLGQVVDLLRRRDPVLAKGLADAAGAALTADTDTPQHRLVSLLEEFERQAERVLDEFGRV